MVWAIPYLVLSFIIECYLVVDECCLPVNLEHLAGCGLFPQAAADVIRSRHHQGTPRFPQGPLGGRWADPLGDPVGGPW